MKNRFLDKFRRGEPSVGTFFEMGGPAVGEMIALTDLDYFVIDGEHGPYDVLQAADIIRAAEGGKSAGAQQKAAGSPVTITKKGHGHLRDPCLRTGAEGGTRTRTAIATTPSR